MKAAEDWLEFKKLETSILGLIAACTIEDTENRDTWNEYKKRKKNARKAQWTQKQWYGQFIRQTTGKASENQWGWLWKGCIKRTTEALIIAAQEQAMRINNIKAKIDKTKKKTVNVECMGKLGRV